MAKVDITNENESKQETSTYKGFNNKFLKAALLAVGSYYLAKKDPYVLKGINDVKDKLEEADSESRRDYIKASATSIGKVIAENRARRKERVIDFKEKIKNLNQYTKGDSYLSANIIKNNLYKDMMKHGKDGKDITALFNITDEFRKTTPTGLSNSELASALAGPVDNISKNLNTKFLAPKKTSFISNFITGGGQEDVSEEVKAQIQALAPETEFDNIEDIYIGGGSLTEKGLRFQRPKIAGGLTETKAQKQIMDAVAISLGGTVKVDRSSGEIVYSYDSEIQKRLQNASSVTGGLLLEVEKEMSEQGYTRREAVQRVIDKYKLGSPNITPTYPAIAKIFTKKKQSNPPLGQGQTGQGQTGQGQTSPATVTSIQNQLLNLKANPPSGTNKRAAATSYVRKRDQLKAKLVSILVKDPSNSKYYNNQKAAQQYANGFLTKNKI